MNYEDNLKKKSDCLSPIEDEIIDWEDFYNLSDYDDYELCSDYYELTKSPFGERKSIDSDCFDFPASFVSFDFENLFPQRVTACSVGMVKYKNGII